MAYFGASCDTPEYNKEFADELMLDFPLLSDPTRKTAKEYGLVADDKGFPKRWTYYVGLDGKIARIDKMVKPDGHGEEIAKTLKELGIPKAEKPEKK